MFRLESDHYSFAAQRCSECGRAHRRVLTFREVIFVVPEDPSQAVRREDGARTKSVGVACAYKLLSQVPSMLYAATKAALDRINGR